MAEATLYITEHPDKRLIICANSLNSLNASLPKTVDILINNKNIFIELSNFNDIVSLSNQLKLHGSTVPKIVMGLPVRTYNELHLAAHYAVSDVYLDEPLVFDLFNVRKSYPIKDGEDKQLYIRVHPARGRNPVYNDPTLQDSGLCHFWITPQTAHCYENYIDVLDLTDENDIRENMLFQVYSKGEYNHGLRSLCANMTSDLPCDFISEEDVYRRISCQQRCMMPGGVKCHYCENLSLMYKIAINWGEKKEKKE